MASNHIRNVAFVGATGQVGKFILSALLEKNTFKVTAITRAGSSAPPSGVAVAPVDYEKPETIVEALKGQDALIITMSVRAPPEQSSILIEAAAKAGVPWVLPNEFGSNTDSQASTDALIGPSKVKDRKLIESLGVSSWIGVATGFWYEYSLAGPGFYGIDIKKREAIFFDDGNFKIPTSTWPQSGKAVANLLSLPIKAEGGNGASLEKYRNKFANVTSFVVNQRDMLQAVQRATNTTDADWTISSVPAKQRFEEARGRFFGGERAAFPILLYTRFFSPEGQDSSRLDFANEDLGLPEEDFDEATKEAVRLSNDRYIEKMFGL